MEALELKPFTWARQRRTGAILAAGAAGSLLLLGLAAPASGATHPSSKVAVPQGVGVAALKDAGVFGPTPASTPETVSFILKARNLDLLKLSVEVGMPRGYDSVRQFANSYGQPQFNISALENYLSGFGITTTSDADGLDVTATGTAGEFDSALSVQQDQFRLPAVAAKHGMAGRRAMTIHGTTDNALLPRGLASFVLSILGLTDYPTFASDAVHTPKLSSAVKPSAVQTGNLTPEDFASQYNLDPLYKQGATGAGATIGIVTLASLTPSDPEFFWANTLGISK